MVKRDIRLATLADLALMHEWVNAEDSLVWKKNTKHIISNEEHAEWFQSRLADLATQIWIILSDVAPSGQVRLEKKVIWFMWTFMLSRVCGEKDLPVLR